MRHSNPLGPEFRYQYAHAHDGGNLAVHKKGDGTAPISKTIKVNQFPLRVTPVTCYLRAWVTRKPAWIKAVTPVSHVSQEKQGQAKVARSSQAGPTVHSFMNGRATKVLRFSGDGGNRP